MSNDFVKPDDEIIKSLLSTFAPTSPSGANGRHTTRDFSRGGESNIINEYIYKFANNISIGLWKNIVFDENFHELLRFVRKYSLSNYEHKQYWVGERINLFDSPQNRTESYDGGKILDDKPIFALNLFSNKAETFILDEHGVRIETILPSEEQRLQFTKRLFEAIEEDRLDKFIGNPIIAEVSKGKFNFEFYNEKISELVSRRIREDGFFFTIPSWLYLEYLDLSPMQNDNTQTIPNEKSVPTSILTEEIKKFLARGISRDEISKEGGRRDMEGFDESGQTIPWPEVILEDLEGQQSVERVQFLDEFSSLEDKNLYTYGFSHYTETDDYKEFEPPWFGGLFGSGRRSTNDVIEKSLRIQFTDMILKIMIDLQDDDNLEQTFGRYFRDSLSVDSQNLIEKITEFILIDKEIARRIQFWRELVADDDGNLDEDEEKAALGRSLDAWAAGQAEDVSVLTEEDIANRQKFFKQCALMMNLPTLRQAYDSILKQRFEGKLFDDRFYMAHCAQGGQEKLLSNLLTSANEQKLLEIPGHVLSSLVPKVRLFKVTEKGDKIINTEFIFNSTADNSTDRKQGATFLAEEFDKGNGCGLKEFSFEFNGTNPAEARNDIKATLKLYFQSFNDFIRERKSSNGKTYKYVDLIIQPKPDETSINIVSDRHYEPSFYRIRADIGYHTDGIQDEGIRKAIEVSNKTMFLNMVDHDIQFKNDGSVEISISYRAYLESLLKHPRLDALASPELIKKREDNAKLLADELSKRRCSKERIQELQVSIAAAETAILKRSLSSIVDRLRRRGAIYSTQINEEDRKQFLSEGYFKKCRLKGEIIIPKTKNGVFNRDKNNADIGVVLNNELPENSEDFNFLNSTNNLVQFFFFGDLLYTILDCIYEKGSKLRKNSGFQNSKILLGSFEFDPFQITGVNDRVFNIAHIPISVDFFSRWFVDEVMAQKSTRKSFPVLNFMRSLTNQLIKPSLLETCVNRNVDKTLRFQTSQITAYHEGKIDPLNSYNKVGDNDQIGMEVMNLRSEGKLPLKGGGPNDDLNNLYNYIVLSTAGSSLSYSGNGKYLDDIEQGRLHVNIGQNNGLVKSISLSKSDQQYIREARFFQQGIDGLLQLSAVYVATLEMFGNTLFYPGMEFFFNPYGLGGALHFGSPTDANSVANKLGIGGYHTITSVRSSITPGSFKTTVAGQQYYSGDGSGNPNLRGKGSKKKEDDNLENYVPDVIDDDACETVILGVQNFKYDDLEDQADNIEGVSSDDPPESDNSAVIVEQDLHGKKPGDTTTMIVDGIEEDGILILGGPYEDELFFEYIDSSGEGTNVIPTGMEYPEQ